MDNTMARTGQPHAVRVPSPALIRERQSNRSAAKADVRRILEIAPNHERAKLARDLLRRPGG